MDATKHTDVELGSSDRGAQLAFYELSDELWLPVLLEHLARGGCIVIERTGTLLIMPGPFEGA